MDKTYNPHGVKIGEVWVENDPRHPRKICVMEFLDHVCPRNGAGYARIKNFATGKMSEARLDRFNGRRSGYSRAEEK
jgi:hypothetical protein